MIGVLFSALPALLLYSILTVSVVFFIRLMIRATQYLYLVNYEKNIALQKAISDTGDKTSNRK